MANVKEHINPKTGLVPIKFLGRLIDPADPERGRAGEAGLGLRVDQIMGVAPQIAENMIAKGTAELVIAPAKPSAKAAKAPVEPKPAA